MASVSKGRSSQSLLLRCKVLLRHQHQRKILPKGQRPHSQSATTCAPGTCWSTHVHGKPGRRQTGDTGNRASNYTGESLVIKSLAGQTEKVTQLYIFVRILKCTLKGILFKPIKDIFILWRFHTMYLFVVLFCFCFFETGFLCGALAVLEPTL